MKTQTLLIAAAALAAGVMSSHAQVYSQNIVGYVNIPLVAGQNLIANQLDYDGTGTNNTVNTVFPNGLPNKTTIQAWNPTTSSFVLAEYFTSSGWNSGTNSPVVYSALQPGSGFFIKVSAPTNITLVGNVITGTNTYPVPSGFTVQAPSAPIAGTLDTTNGYHPSNKDTVQVWNPTTSSFSLFEYFTSGGWTPSDPQLAVGQAVFLKPVRSTNWTQVLNVQ
jgi:hypothetical protein